MTPPFRGFGVSINPGAIQGNLAPGTTGQLAAAMRHQLDRIQRRPSLITGFLGQTGLTLDSQPP